MKSVNSLLKVLDTSLNGIMVFTPVHDEQNTIVDFEWQLVNKQSALYVGKDASDLLGKRLLEIMPENHDHGLFDRYVQVFETGKSQEFEVQYTDQQLNSWFQIQAVKVDNSLTVTFFDITKLKHIEAELIRKETLLLEAQDLAKLGSWSWNLIDNSVKWSANVFRIYEIEDPDFQPSYSFFIESMVPDDRMRIKETLRAAIENSKPYDINFRIQGADKIKFLEARAIPRINADHSIEAYIGIIKDVTFEKTKEAELRKSDIRARRTQKVASSERMAKSIAHEIRNPLTNITLASEQLRSEKDPESTELFLDMISRNSHRIENLIRKLMDSARQATLNINSHNINDILDAVILLAMDRIKLRKVKIIKVYEPKMCDISVDEEKVKMALLNIVINAIEAITRNGQVKIETQLTDEECIAIISDNGCGIEDDQLNQLFDPFYTGKKKGLGLGLTTTLNILNSHDANVEVESEIGKGTYFYVFFKL